MDLARWIAVTGKMVEIKRAEAPEVEIGSRYKEELSKEVPYVFDKFNVVQWKEQYTLEYLNDSLVEFTGPLSAAVAYIDGNDDQG